MAASNKLMTPLSWKTCFWVRSLGRQASNVYCLHLPASALLISKLVASFTSQHASSPLEISDGRRGRTLTTARIQEDPSRGIRRSFTLFSVKTPATKKEQQEQELYTQNKNDNDGLEQLITSLWPLGRTAQM
mmetsp:Transcript_55682/g.121655  ORF Transcript_55682/g.121655 Transcript_55682/m.121655 type:complete len:132 (+) Transcript_55682:1214-1609(+)